MSQLVIQMLSAGSVPAGPFISHADYSPPAPFISYALGPYATALEGEEEDVMEGDAGAATDGCSWRC